MAVITIVCLAAAIPRPAPAINIAEGKTATNISFAILYSVLIPVVVYFMWKNRPSQQTKVDWSLQGPGGYFFGPYMGAALVQSNRWRFWGREPSYETLPVGYDFNTSRVNYTPGVVGGLKFGRFFHRLPHFGWQLDGCFTRNDIRNQKVTLDAPVLGTRYHYIPTQDLYILNLAAYIMFRYGFWKDKEVTFGRLQPYVGLGPGLVIIWGDVDSAKNFSLEALAGVRYMVRKNFSVFIEYKISQQWDVQLGHQKTRPQGPTTDPWGERRGQAHFDWTSHKIILGVNFHFL